MPTLVSVTVTPDPAATTDDDVIQFTATGHWSDSSTSDITRTVDVVWTSSNETVATVNTGISRGGLAFGRTVGTTTIAANYVTPSDTVITGSVTLTVSAAPPLADPDGRVNVAFGWTTLDANPTWTRLDDHPNLVTSYSIQRGRNHELDRENDGRATVEIIDPDGVLDTTNPDSPGYNMIRPLVQACIGRRNPVTGEWSLRFRGFVETFDYGIDPSERFNRLTITLVDLFELLNATEMQPGQFGDPPMAGSDTEAQIWYPSGHSIEQRLGKLLDSYGLPHRFRAVMPGNVMLYFAIYSPGETVMSAVTETCDAEGPPSLSNVYVDRRGRLAFQGRQGRLDPAGLMATVTGGEWDFHDWKAGDGDAIAASPSDTVQIRELSFNRGVPSIINSASATPAVIDDSEVAGQLVVDTDSIGFYGIRSWSANSLLTFRHLDTDTHLDEAKRFATFIVLNYRDIRDRPSAGFRSLLPEDSRAPALWDFLNSVDLGDRIQITVTAGGAGGPVFTPGGSDMFFVDGIQEDVRPTGRDDVDDVTLTLTLTAQEYYMHNPWAGE